MTRTRRIYRRSPLGMLRQWMLRNSPGDEFVVSVTTFLRDDSQRKRMLDRGFSSRTRPGTLPIAFTLESLRFAARDGETRQQGFDEALTTLRQRLTDAGVDGPFLAAHGGFTMVYTSLTPVTGMADVFLYPEALEQWRELKTLFHFDVIER